MLTSHSGTAASVSDQDGGIKKRRCSGNNCIILSHSKLNSLPPHKRVIAPKYFALYWHLLYIENLFPTGQECKWWKLSIIKQVIESDKLDPNGTLWLFIQSTFLLV